MLEVKKIDELVKREGDDAGVRFDAIILLLFQVVYNSYLQLDEYLDLNHNKHRQFYEAQIEIHFPHQKE